MNYEQTAEAIALAIWETSTGNGHKIDRDDWDSHMQNCHAAVANTYTEDMTEAQWHDAALERLTGDKGSYSYNGRPYIQVEAAKP